MGLFDWLAQKTQCPLCGRPGAKRFLWQVKCSNIACSKFDRSFLYEQSVGPSISAKSAPSPTSITGTFDPGVDSIQVRYRNFRGEEKTFVGDRTTARLRGNHISICLAPTGSRVAFSKERIQNLSDLDEIIRKQTMLTRKERQILGYHKKHGTTSPLYESIRRKYPNL